MPAHNLQCPKCGEIVYEYFASPWIEPMHDCGGRFEILWTPTVRHDASVYTTERSVVYEDPKTGEIVYPARADVPMAERYRKRGFQRIEFEHGRDLEKFEKSHNVANEGYWYNSGNGV